MGIRFNDDRVAAARFGVGVLVEGGGVVGTQAATGVSAGPRHVQQRLKQSLSDDPRQLPDGPDGFADPTERAPGPRLVNLARQV